MGAIEDACKLLQNFVAPELRAIAARLDAVDQRSGGVDKRVDGLEKAMREGEERVLKSVEQAQHEVLPNLRLAQAEQRNAERGRQIKALASKPAQQ